MEKLLHTINSIVAPDTASRKAVQARLDMLTKPPGSLGLLEEIAVQLGGITGATPQLGEKVIMVMAGDHGVAEAGVSAFPQEVTPQMVLNFISGGAAINVLARHAGARVVVADIGVKANLEHPDLVSKKIRMGTDNMLHGPAMTREDAVKAIEAGIELAEEQIRRGARLIGTGDMGIANTTPSSAILAVLGDLDPGEIVGRGTGIDDAGLKHKETVIREAIRLNRPDPADALDVLTKVGGLEIAAIAGCILGAAAQRVPVVVDGFISGAGALVAAHLQPNSREYMLASHVSEEPGHRYMLNILGLKPMLHMHMRLGEGTGAALAFLIIEAAVKVLHEMSTFAEAGVSGKSN
ncbi:MAG: nicotinate-nucleotide--dimethylbenzimidazole phosphoribosyltransferase [Bacillota bacterium]